MNSTTPLCLLALALSVAPAAAFAQASPKVAPNAPPDRPQSAMPCQWWATVHAMEPFVARARATWPAARARALAGLPAGHTLFVTTRLTDRRGKVEQVFVAVDSIGDQSIHGHIANDIGLVEGYANGDAIVMPESQLIDWTIARPDGTEEGNVVGTFLDEYHPPACADSSRSS